MSRCLLDSRMGQVHCIVAGEGAGVPLLLLHQTPRSVDEYAEVLPLLARERRVIALDTPGYGCSDRVPGQPSIADYAGAAIDVLDALGIERATVVGHHTGGRDRSRDGGGLCSACRPRRAVRARLHRRGRSRGSRPLLQAVDRCAGWLAPAREVEPDAPVGAAPRARAEAGRGPVPRRRGERAGAFRGGGLPDGGAAAERALPGAVTVLHSRPVRRRRSAPNRCAMRLRRAVSRRSRRASSRRTSNRNSTPRPCSTTCAVRPEAGVASAV